MPIARLTFNSSLEEKIPRSVEGKTFSGVGVLQQGFLSVYFQDSTKEYHPHQIPISCFLLKHKKIVFYNYEYPLNTPDPAVFLLKIVWHHPLHPFLQLVLLVCLRQCLQRLNNPLGLCLTFWQRSKIFQDAVFLFYLIPPVVL